MGEPSIPMGMVSGGTRALVELESMECGTFSFGSVWREKDDAAAGNVCVCAVDERTAMIGHDLDSDCSI